MKAKRGASRSRSSDLSPSDAAGKISRSQPVVPAKRRSGPPDLRIGISGWTYRPWRGTFYPTGLPQKRELEFASRKVNSIEINGSFYSLQRPSSYRLWYEQTPEDFVFSVKGGRFITHLKRLQNVETPLANFFASGVLLLQEKLGPILWQLPPNYVFNPEKLARFFELLPQTTSSAAALARQHDERLKNRAWTETDAPRPLRHALEVRHDSFKNPAFIALLRAHKIGLVIADTAGNWPLLEDTTADFVYIRLHGDEELYVSGYSENALGIWRDKILEWSQGKVPSGVTLIGTAEKNALKRRDVFVYFDNDVKVRSPYDAMTLAHGLGIGPRPGNSPDAKTINEVARTVWPAIGRRWKISTS